MAFTLILGTCSDEPLVLNKTFISADSLTISPLDTVDVLNPYIIINYSASILGYNYAKIPDFNNRYYFVKSELLTSGRIGLTLTVDPLMSWYDRGLGGNGIKDITTTIIRTGALGGSDYTTDKEFPLSDSKKKISVYNFGFNPHAYNTYAYPHAIIHTI